MLEYEYIKYFRENTDYIVINERKSINIEEYYNIKPPIKKKICVALEDYEFAKVVLEHNGIKIIE